MSGGAIDERSRVLVVDDEPAIRESLAYALGRDGFAVLEAANLRAARACWAAADLIVLDLMLPDGSGIEFLRALRRQSRVPVIVLSSRGEETDRVVGLELGADDYVVKPFSPRELVARIRAVLRRTQPEAPPAGAAAAGPVGLWLSEERRQCGVGSAEVKLSRLEFDILVVLLGARGRVIQRQTLLERVWGDCVVGLRTVDVHIKALRRKLEDAGGAADLIETVRGVGYRLRESA